MNVLKSRIGKILGAIALTIILSIAYIGWFYTLREVNTTYDSPAEHFKYGSIGTENEQGVPYLIWEVLPRLFPEYLPRPGGYTALGLTWEEGQEMPVGISKKTVGVPRQGITCAVCHSGTYRKTATDKPIIVPTAPATKFDSLGYVRFLEACAKDPRFTADNILPEIEYNHPLSLLDQLVYRFAVIPITRKLVLEQGQDFAWTRTRPDWGPGRIDPFNPVKFRTLGLPLDDTIGNSDMMPIWNQKARDGFALHWDGLETSLTETVNTGAIGDGATLKSIPIKDLQRVEQYITEFEPPAYPFAIDTALAEQGKPIFEQNCATCHAFGGDRTGTVIPQTEVGTDRHRLDMWTQEAADTYNNYAEGYPFDFDELRKTDGYLSPALDGLWLRGPYLHNGSVPSLVDLLKPPADRTPVFYRGYDVLDSEQVGFISQGQDAERLGFKLDTAIEGNSNQGHLYGTDLAPEDKTALVEYLKTL